MMFGGYVSEVFTGIGGGLMALGTFVVGKRRASVEETRIAIEGLTALVEQLRATVEDDRATKQELRLEVQRLRVHVSQLEGFLKGQGLTPPEAAGGVL